jgi:hypothetical protein
MPEWVWVRTAWHRLTSDLEDDDKLKAACGIRIPRNAAGRPDPDPPVQDRCPVCDGRDAETAAS